MNIYYIALTAHIMGITMMAGATLVDYVIYKQCWKYLPDSKPKALVIHEGLSKIPLLIGIGIMLLIISGVTMMQITKGVFGEQLWFRIKFGLVLLIIINGLAVGRRQGLKLAKLLLEATLTEAKLLKIKNNLTLFHLSQLVLFVIIFILSVFKFN
ncbi:hypothetical protein [Chitinophaga sp. CF118]|uniref:hypothetical protein n=1 Tax=Chitinophaga sp. CF118 TaxID=1884367 RepID=UPI00116069CE|nr:hypothetical protein [Chitinophaga sp. CF118]